MSATAGGGAVSSAGAPGIRAALARLRGAAPALRAALAAGGLDALAAVFDRFRDPASPERRRLAAELPAAAGFAPETLCAGLDHGFGAWSGDDFLAQLRAEAGEDPARSGFAVTGSILAGAIPMPTLLEIAAPLALGSPVLVKPSAHDPLTARVVRESLGPLAPFVEVARFGGGDAAASAAFCEAECVVANGSDETLARIAAQTRGQLVGHGHRLSAVALGPDGDATEQARAIAFDTALWDQLGCLSPVAVWLVGDAARAEALGAALAGALADAQARWPRGTVPDAAAARLAAERDTARMRAVPVWGGAGEAWTVVAEIDAGHRSAPLYRFLRVHPAADAEALVAALRPLSAHLACVATAGFGSDAERITHTLRRLGASRVCAPGVMQAPPLAWRRDGLGVFEPLLRRS